MIYLDNAATFWPKPDCVPEAMLRYMREVGANPGRSGHRLANQAERIRFDARETVAELLGLSASVRCVLDRGLAEIRTHEQTLTGLRIGGLGKIAGVRVFGTRDTNCQVAVVSFVVDGQPVSETAVALDEQFAIMC